MRKGFPVVMAVILALSLFTVTYASERRVFDEAGLFDSYQITSLESSIANIKEQISMDIVIVTINDAEGKSSMEYADDFYDYGGFGTGSKRSGVLFLIDMDNREAYISTCGDMISYLDDQRIDYILDDAYMGLETGDYYSAADSFLGGVEYYVLSGLPEGHYAGGRNDPDERSLTIAEIIIALLIASVAGAAVCLFIYARYKMKLSLYAYPLTEKSSLVMTGQEDIFINQTHTRHRIQTSSGGGSKSTTHRSSSGTRHGGGGKKF